MGLDCVSIGVGQQTSGSQQLQQTNRLMNNMAKLDGSGFVCNAIDNFVVQ